MSIESIQLNGFKGVTAKDKLGPLNLIVGPNGGGKTARLEAIQLAIQGYTVHGKRPMDTATLIGEHGEVMVEVREQDGTLNRIARHVVRTDTGSSVVAYVNGCQENAAKAQSRIANLVGRNGAVFAPIFDLDEFLKLSAAKKIDFLFGLCASTTSLTWAGICGRIKDALSPAAASMAGDVGGLMVGTHLGGDTPLSALAKMIDDIKAHRDQCHKNALAAEAAIKNADPNAPPTKPLHELRTERAELLKQKEEYAAETARVNGLVAQSERIYADWEHAQKQLAALQFRADELRATELPAPAPADELNRRADELCKTHPGTPRDLHGLDREINNIEREINALNHAATLTGLDSQQNEAMLDRLDDLIEGHEHSPFPKLKKLFNDLTQAITTERLNPLWTEAYAIVDDHYNAWCHDQQSHKDRIEQREAERASLAATKKEMHQTAKQLAEADRRHQEAERALRQAKTENEQFEQVVRWRTEAAGVLDQHKRHAQCLLAAEEGITKQTRDCAALEARYNEVTGTTTAGQDAEQALLVAAALEGIDAEIDAATRAAERQAARKRHEIAIADWRERWDHAKAVLAAAENQRNALLADSLDPIRTAMLQFTKKSSITEWVPWLKVDEETASGLQMGIVRDNNFIPHSSLSGGERVMFGTALIVGLVLAANPKLKLVMIEAGEVDGPNLYKLMLALEAVSGDLDNIIVATHNGPQTVDLGLAKWNVIATGTETITKGGE